MAETIRLDMDSMSLGDLEDFEEHTGQALQDAIAERPVIDPETGKPKRGERGRLVKEVQLSMKSLVAIVWLVKRSEDPTFTYAQARALKVKELEIVAPVEDAEGKDDGATD
jgi:hypothetical protein